MNMTTCPLHQATLKMEELGLIDDLKEEVVNYLDKKVTSNCSAIITSGKLKNTRCKRKPHIGTLCKIHAKHLVKSNEVEQEVIIQLIEKIDKNGNKFWITSDNIVYEKTSMSYCAVGKYKKGHQTYYIEYN